MGDINKYLLVIHSSVFLWSDPWKMNPLYPQIFFFSPRKILIALLVWHLISQTLSFDAFKLLSEKNTNLIIFFVRQCFPHPKVCKIFSWQLLSLAKRLIRGVSLFLGSRVFCWNTFNGGGFTSDRGKTQIVC